MNKMTPAGLRNSAEFFQQAIDLDSSFAPAWSGLAGAHALRAYYGSGSSAVHLPPARAAASRALELNDQLSSAHSALGWIRFFEWDWSGAGKEFETALAINPNDLFARHGWGDYHSRRPP